MAISVISISSNSSKESVGMSNARVILFGTIPTTIPSTIPTVDSPTIPPIAPTIVYTSLFVCTDSSNSDTSKRPPSQDPYEILPAPSSLPRRPAILVLPVDYSSSDHFTADDSSRDSLSDSLLETSSDSHSDTSFDSSSRHSSSISDSSCDSPTATSVGPSHKRCRSPTTSVPVASPISGALSPVRANLLPPRKRIRDFDSVTDFEDREIGLGVDVEDIYEPYIEPDIDSDVQADIDACIMFTDDIAARGTDVRVEVGTAAEEEAKPSARGTIEIGVDRVTHPVILNDTAESVREDFPELVSANVSLEVIHRGLDVVMHAPYDHMVEILVHRVRVIESVMRDQGHRIAATSQQSAAITLRVLGYSHVGFGGFHGYIHCCIQYIWRVFRHRISGGRWNPVIARRIHMALCDSAFQAPPYPDYVSGPEMRFSQLRSRHYLPASLTHCPIRQAHAHESVLGWIRKEMMMRIYTVMSDFEDSTVTYTAVSSPFEDLPNIRSPGVDGPPVMPEDPYAYVVAAFQAPLSPDYVTGYVPESDPDEDPEEDDNEDPEEDPADYPVDGGDYGDDEDESSDDDEDDDVDIEEDEEEEEHPAAADSTAVALPAVDQAPSAKETKPFETNEFAVTPPPHPAYRVTARISIRDEPPTPFWSDTEIPSPPLPPILSPLPVSSPLPQIPLPPLPVSSPVLVLSPSPPASLICPLGYRAAMIRLRAEAASTSHSLPLPPPIIPSYTRPDAPSSGTPPLHLLSTDRKANRPEVTLPPRKRLGIALGPRYEVRESLSATARPTGGLRTDYGFVTTIDREIMRDLERDVSYGITETWDEMLVDMPGAPATDDTEMGRRMTEFTTRVRQDTYEIYMRLDNEQSERQLMAGRLNMLYRDRRTHARTARLMKAEDKMTREA
ncbi:hypothetical protein Tco_0601645 [Tanacetum coccineum]